MPAAPAQPAHGRTRLLATLLPLALAIAGCGGSGYSANPSAGTFSITPGTSSISTSGQLQFSATLPDGTPATNVHWVIVAGQNDTNFGEGSIDSSGLYLPPSALSQDSVQVKVQANLTSNTFQSASAVITVTPSFIQPVTPENAALSPGATLPLTASISEVGGGTVQWSLSTSPTSAASPGSTAGTLSSTHCQRSSPRSANPSYTSCTVTYTAPSAVPAQPVYILGTVQSNPGTVTSSRLLLNSAGLNSSPLSNQAAQTSAVQMGSSGGNNNDVDVDASGNILDCASGTLGALVADQASNLYILSNNHVLAESDQAGAGNSIIQPGLVDTGCTQLTTGSTGMRSIGTLQYWAPLLNNSVNIDAALANTSAASVDSTGAILSLGAPGSGTNAIGAAAPAGGTGEALTAANLNNLRVAKSGRTTGLTCSTVDVINAAVKVSYYKDAAETQFYTAKTFINQIGIPGNSFSDSGDSGALVVDTSNAQPVGLFYAASSGTSTSPGESFANPIGDVLTELAQYSSAPAGTSFSVVGGAPHPVTCLDFDSNTARSSSAVAEIALGAAQAVVARESARLVDPGKGILGLAAGVSLDQPGQPAVLVYVDRDHANDVTVPQTLGGLPTRVIATTAHDLASNTVAANATATTGIHLSATVLDAARAVAQQHTAEVLSDPAYFGIGVSQSLDHPQEAALMVFVDRTRRPRSAPATIGGVRVRYRVLSPIRVNAHAAAQPLPAAISH